VPEVADEPELETLLEALLFCSGDSRSVSQISETLGRSVEDVTTSLESLSKTMKRRRGGALQIVNVGGRWSMEVQPKLSSFLPAELRGDIPERLQRAAALIAYHQPMIQSDLVEMMGQIAYEYVRSLARLGLIDRRRKGNSRRLVTTRRFAERFQCPAVEPAKVRTWFREQAAAAGLNSADLVESIRVLDPNVGDETVVDSDEADEIDDEIDEEFDAELEGEVHT
jgi:segregation and condensation protein B